MIEQGVKRIFWLDLRSLALMRIALGSVLLFDLLFRALYLEAHYTDAGVLPRSALLDESSLFFSISIYFISGYKHVVGLLYLIQIAAAIGLIVGYRTRLMTVLSWFLLLSLHERNPFVNFGADFTLLAYLFWMVFLPMGARWSIDALKSSVKEDLIYGIRPAILLGQIFVYYVFASLLKYETAWTEGSATYLSFMNLEYGRPLGAALVTWSSGLAEMLTYGTRIVEFFSPFLLLLPAKRARIWMVIVLISFHVASGVFLTLGTFPWVTSAVLLAVLPGHTSERIAQVLRPFRWSKISAFANQISRGSSAATSQFVTWFMVINFFIIVLTNIGTLTQLHFFHGISNAYVQMFHMGQDWGFFGPRPPSATGWSQLVATDAQGVETELLTENSPPVQEITFLKDIVWHNRHYNYWIALPQVSNKYHAFLCRYYMKKWKAKIDIQKIEIRFVMVWIKEGGAYSEPKVQTLGHMDAQGLYTPDTSFKYLVD
jgi:hypothetical protein